jgi:hypothetical protein
MIYLADSKAVCAPIIKKSLGLIAISDLLGMRYAACCIDSHSLEISIAPAFSVSATVDGYLVLQRLD